MRIRYILAIALVIGLLISGLFWLFMPNFSSLQPGRALNATASVICPQNWDTLVDSDGDGLPDVVEEVYGTDPTNPDTSGDGVSDGKRFLEGCNPNMQGCVPLDSTGDGMTDIEKCAWGLEPFTLDSSGDGIPDGQKIRMGLDPKIPHNDSGGDVLPASFGESSLSYIDMFRPTTDTDNLTTALAALLIGDRSPQDIQDYNPSPEELHSVFSRIKLDTTLPEIGSEMIARIEENNAETILRYFSSIDSIRPQTTADRSTVSQAIERAAAGSTGSLKLQHARYMQYGLHLGEIPAPPSTMLYHKHLIGMVVFLTDRIAEILVHGESDPARAWKAAREIEIGMPQHLETLTQLRKEAEDLAQPATPPLER